SANHRMTPSKSWLGFPFTTMNSFWLRFFLFFLQMESSGGMLRVGMSLDKGHKKLASCSVFAVAHRVSEFRAACVLVFFLRIRIPIPIAASRFFPNTLQRKPAPNLHSC